MAFFLERILPTVNQLVRNPRKRKRRKPKTPALRYAFNTFANKQVELKKGSPQKRGTFCPRDKTGSEAVLSLISILLLPS